MAPPQPVAGKRTAVPYQESGYHPNPFKGDVDMAKTSLTDRRAKLAEKQRQIEAKLKTLDAKAAAQVRKDETRRKVIVGALALRHAELNQESEFSKKIIELIAHEIETTAAPKARENLQSLFASLLIKTAPLDAAEPPPSGGA
jgi:hypothetical protein